MFRFEQNNQPRAQRPIFDLKRLTSHCVQSFNFPLQFTASPEKTAKGRKWAQLLSELLVKTNLRPNPVLIMPRGLASVPQGYQYMSEGKVRIRTRTLTSTLY